METLGTHLVNRIIKWFIFTSHDAIVFEQLITVTLEKPSAVMFAESPMVEVRRHANPRSDETGISNVLFEEVRAMQKRVGKSIESFARIPFPLQGRLDEWIRATDPEDTTV